MAVYFPQIRHALPNTEIRRQLIFLINDCRKDYNKLEIIHGIAHELLNSSFDTLFFIEHYPTEESIQIFMWLANRSISILHQNVVFEVGKGGLLEQEIKETEIYIVILLKLINSRIFKTIWATLKAEKIQELYNGFNYLIGRFQKFILDLNVRFQREFFILCGAETSVLIMLIKATEAFLRCKLVNKDIAKAVVDVVSNFLQENQNKLKVINQDILKITTWFPFETVKNDNLSFCSLNNIIRQSVMDDLISFCQMSSQQSMVDRTEFLCCLQLFEKILNTSDGIWSLMANTKDFECSLEDIYIYDTYKPSNVSEATEKLILSSLALKIIDKRKCMGSYMGRLRLDKIYRYVFETLQNLLLPFLECSHRRQAPLEDVNQMMERTYECWKQLLFNLYYLLRDGTIYQFLQATDFLKLVYYDKCNINQIQFLDMVVLLDDFFKSLTVHSADFVYLLEDIKKEYIDTQMQQLFNIRG